jgi:hypothetical protein
MRQHLLALLIGLFVSASCANQSDDSLTDLKFSTVKEFEGNASDTCFDVQMDVWMEKFQHYQQTGSDMFDADLKAREASLNAYRDCQHRKSKAIVTNEARKD